MRYQDIFQEAIQIDFEHIVNCLSQKKEFFWFDSADDQGVSILAFHPRREILFSVEDIKEFKQFSQNQLPKVQLSKTHLDDLPFQGGWIACLDYEAYSLNPSLQILSHSKTKKPVARFYECPEFILYRHDTKQATYYNLTESAFKDWHRLCDFFKKDEEIEFKSVQKLSGDLVSQWDFDDYKKRFNSVKEAIYSGDYFELNLSMEFRKKTPKTPLEIYKHLRKISPNPMMVFFKISDDYILSSSPERFFEIRQGYLHTYPIKGTAPRGSNEDQDRQIKDDLINGEKEQAELMMVTDMLRNDLGRICRTGSIKVLDLASVHSFSHYHHLISHIQGEIEPQTTFFSIFSALFPGGSITGAPKIQVMKHIQELEERHRGVYTGAVGYIGYNGDMDFNIPIRTLTVQDQQVHFSVGGGIVADSQVELEYQECLIKAAALREVL